MKSNQARRIKYFLICALLVSSASISLGQNGTLVSNTPLDLAKTNLWEIIAKNDTLLAKYAYAENLRYSEIVYQSDSLNIEGLLIAPKAKGNYPVIIFNRGGNRDYGALSLNMLFFSTALLVNEGYIILASNYRTQDEFGGNDIHDVLNLIDVAAHIEHADTARIGMFGWSRGGMMTYLALKKSKRIQTAVIGNGPSDLFSTIQERPEMEHGVIAECVPNYWANKDAELKKRSAIFWADSLNKESSLLLLCGSLDAQVDHQQSIRMAEKLAAINYDHELKIYETDHAFRDKRNELNTELISWFKQHLKGPSDNEKTKIAITIDDVPNTRRFESNNYRSYLLESLDSMQIPVAIYINEGQIYKTADTTKNRALLEEWIKKEYVTLGNHSYSHFRYSDTPLDAFKADIEKGEIISRQLAQTYNKSIKTFRFPFNDLGLDSTQHVLIDSVLNSMSYTIAPFTVESSDWMFNAVYEYYMAKSEFAEATRIGELYLTKTMDYIHFFDSLSTALYGRKIRQIYLCHDNALNARYLKDIVRMLEVEGAEFVSMDEAMKDPVYTQKNSYYKKWGVSWLYRWMPTQSDRVRWMKLEPDMQEIEGIYELLFEANK